jgi:glutamyl-tRNA reductase
MQNSLAAAKVTPTIDALQERLETVRQTELEPAWRRQVSFRPEQHDAIEELTRGIVTRILHGPLKVLESASDDKDPAALLSIVHRVFNLGDKAAGRLHRDCQGP